MKCIVCSNKKFELVWNNKIRSSANKFTKKKEKILQCLNCKLVFLKKRRKYLENSAVSRDLYNKNKSINEFIKFHTMREFKKLNFIRKKIDFKNKKILESNCGAGILITNLKKRNNTTAGLDNIFYKKFLESRGHIFFKSINEIIKKKLRFDIILSFSEIEHKENPLEFLKSLKSILNKKGKIIVRIPNYYNIYMYLLGNNFFKYDYRTSHNYYFSKKNLDIMFNKLGFKIDYSHGMNEYSLNHLLTYIKKNRRVKSNEVINLFSKKIDKNIVRNIQKSWSSTSLIYILSH